MGVDRDERIEAFVADITARWPQIDDMPEEDVDECPWNVAFDQSPGHVISAIAWSRVEEVVPVFVETAHRHGLLVFDPQADALYAPEGGGDQPV